MGVGRRELSVLVLVLVGSAGCRESTDSPAEPAPVIAGLADRCPDPATPIPYPPDGRLPDGAVGVRLCNGIEDFGGPDDFQADVDAPADELTTNVEDLVDLVNAADAVPDEQACTFDAGPDLAFWFRYPDGTARAVRYARYGCRNFLVGEDRARVGGDGVHAAFSDRLLAQREGLRPPGGSPPSPDCSDRQVEPALEVASGVDPERAVVCWLVDVTWRQSRELTARQVQLLEDDFNVDSGSRGGACRPLRHTRILAISAWGDRIDLGGTCLTFQVPDIRGPSADSYPAYRPSPAVERMFLRVTAGNVQ